MTEKVQEREKVRRGTGRLRCEEGSREWAVRLRRVTHLAEFGTSIASRLASLSSPKHLVKRFFDHHYMVVVGLVLHLITTTLAQM